MYLPTIDAAVYAATDLHFACDADFRGTYPGDAETLTLEKVALLRLELERAAHLFLCL